MVAGKDPETELEARCCIVCRTPLPMKVRADAQLCSATCRQRAKRYGITKRRNSMTQRSDAAGAAKLVQEEDFGRGCGQATSKS
jgi:predicted nucleic acid-binding Zn ribbon protein